MAGVQLDGGEDGLTGGARGGHGVVGQGGAEGGGGNGSVVQTGEGKAGGEGETGDDLGLTPLPFGGGSGGGGFGSGVSSVELSLGSSDLIKTFIEIKVT